ncbi:hypothetical protein WDB89_00210 [Pseudoalteromonas sp. B5MOD-1]|uniref:hypothetical protein n=1 Tax=Pseudoalteromonas TaxID=53246 RepID=UPI000784E681|nr:MULTISPECIES: hypothetical protein [Pseudoalteromonas]MCO7205024.1 hypothetical protein [Pseudoalteromonas sp. CnMc7-37]
MKDYSIYVSMLALLLSFYTWYSQKRDARANVTFTHRLLLNSKNLRITLTNLSTKPLNIIEVKYASKSSVIDRKISLKSSLQIQPGVSVDIDIDLEKESEYLDGVTEFEFISSVGVKHIYKLQHPLTVDLQIEYLKLAATSFETIDKEHKKAQTELINNLDPNITNN